METKNPTRAAYAAPETRVRPASFEKRFLASATIPYYDETTKAISIAVVAKTRLFIVLRLCQGHTNLIQLKEDLLWHMLLMTTV